MKLHLDTWLCILVQGLIFAAGSGHEPKILRGLWLKGALQDRACISLGPNCIEKLLLFTVDDPLHIIPKRAI